MQLRIVVGRGACGKSTWVYEQIKADLAAGPQPVYLVVPEQATLQAEQALIAHLGTPGILQARVVSPAKLASDVFAQVSQDRSAVIGDSGLAMALRSAALPIESELKAFRSVLGLPGFSQQMVQLLREFRQFDVTADTLLQKTDGITGTLRAKAEDIAAISRQFDDYLAARSFTDEDSRFNRFIDRIAEAEFLRGCPVYFDGFEYLSSQQCRMIEQLLLWADSITVTQDFDTEDAPDGDLFQSSRSNIQRLSDAAQTVGAAVQWVHLHRDGRLHPMPPDIAHLERSLFAFPAEAAQGQGQVTLCRAEDIAEEAEAAAAWVLSKARSGDLHWRQFAIQCADERAYAPVLERVFAQYGIPLFIDRRRQVLRHPAVRFVLSLIQVLNRQYRADDVLRLVKSGCLKLRAADEDLLEVYLTAFAPRGSRAWSRDWVKGQDQYDLVTLNRMRRTVHDLATALHKAAGGRSASAGRWARALYGVLENLRFDEALDAQAAALKHRALLEEAAVTERVWNAILDTLDQLCLLADDQPMDAGELHAILQSGFASMEVGILPTGVDQVQAGSLGRLRLGDVRHVLVLGAGEGMLNPKAERGILTERDLDTLFDLGIGVGQSSQMKDAQRRFELYKTITKGADSLYISYSASNTAGAEISPDAVFERIRTLLNIPAAQVLDAGALRGTIPCAAADYPRLPVLLRAIGEGHEATDSELERIRWYLQTPEYSARAHKLLQVLQGHDAVESLPAAALVLGTVTVSASQLERFFSCPFRHFVDFGLRPEQWREHGLVSADAGTFLHAAMERFNQRAMPLLRDPEALQAQAQALMRAQSEELSRDFQYGLLQSDARLRWTGTNLQRICELAAQTFAAQMAQGDFRPFGQELRFGKGGLPAASLSQDGPIAALQGRIDRLDIAPMGDQDMLRVIDYKSSARNIDVTDAVNGLNVQTWLYLWALSRLWPQAVRRDAVPAAAYIFPLIDPWVEEGEDAEATRREKLRLTGWCLNTQQVTTAMDRQAERGRSKLYSFNLQRGNGLLDPDTSQAVLDIVAEHAAAAVSQMRDGCVAVRPWRAGKAIACENCPYGALCRIDVADPKHYRQLLTKDEVQGLLEQHKEGGDGDAVDPGTEERH